tara:strand:- start:23556 stop:24398 length:843 start_codon:yes stop_codon:yes gene_type:complete
MTIDVEGCEINEMREMRYQAEMRLAAFSEAVDAEKERMSEEIKAYDEDVSEALQAEERFSAMTLYKQLESLVKKIKEVVEYYSTGEFISSVFTASGDLRDDFDADDESEPPEGHHNIINFYEFNYLLYPIYDSNEVIYEIMKDILKINYAKGSECENIQDEAVEIFNAHQGALQRHGFRVRENDVWRKNTHLKTGEKYTEEAKHKIQLRRIYEIIGEHFVGACEGIYPPHRKLPLKSDVITGSSLKPRFIDWKHDAEEYADDEERYIEDDTEFYDTLEKV